MNELDGGCEATSDHLADLSSISIGKVIAPCRGRDH